MTESPGCRGHVGSKWVSRGKGETSGLSGRAEVGKGTRHLLYSSF